MVELRTRYSAHPELRLPADDHRDRGNRTPRRRISRFSAAQLRCPVLSAIVSQLLRSERALPKAMWMALAASMSGVAPFWVGLNAQPTIGPELSFATEPLRVGISASKRAARIGPMQGNLGQQFRGFMFPALRQ